MLNKIVLPKESEKRAKIVEVAGKMFMRDGYGGISMDRLAEAVPVSKRTLYNHFKDKKALFTAVMEQRCQSIFSKLQETLNRHNDVEKTLMDMATQFLNRVLEPEAVSIYKIAITESNQFPELSQLFYDCGPKRGALFLTEYFKELNRKGEMKIPNPELAAKIFTGMLSNRVQMQFLLGLKKQLSAKEKNEIISYAVKIFIKGHQ